MNYFDFFMSAPTAAIQEGITRTKRIIDENEKIMCSISGGADSDCMLDLCTKIDTDHKIDYYFFDTGIEMQATKEHIIFLSYKYNVDIKTIKPKKSVPRACKIAGQPFLSKRVSEYISRLQRHNFIFEDAPLSDLLEKYPKCKAALRWWCNDFGGKMNISAHKKLKEFMIENPPDFLISPKCCDYAKKSAAHSVDKFYNVSFIGLRRAEGGARAQSIKTCFVETKRGKQHYPLFWWTDADKMEYIKKFGVVHSAAYTQYGCRRTGCSGCPFNSRFENELKMLENNESPLYTAACNIFGKSYEYTRKYREYKKGGAE